jgi:Skp family chaperone for outer membrane proteins
MAGGLTDKLRGSLEGYLARSAAELDEHRVRSDSQLQLRREELEQKQRELDELRARLDRREQELNTYVAQVQTGLVGR